MATESKQKQGTIYPERDEYHKIVVTTWRLNTIPRTSCTRKPWYRFSEAFVDKQWNLQCQAGWIRCRAGRGGPIRRSSGYQVHLRRLLSCPKRLNLVPRNWRQNWRRACRRAVVCASTGHGGLKWSWKPRSRQRKGRHWSESTSLRPMASLMSSVNPSPSSFFFSINFFSTRLNIFFRSGDGRSDVAEQIR